MASLPGLDSDIYIGSPDAPFPDWRTMDRGSMDDDDAPPTEAELAAVRMVLGFDPDELEDDEVEGDGEPPAPPPRYPPLIARLRRRRPGRE